MSARAPIAAPFAGRGGSPSSRVGLEASCFWPAFRPGSRSRPALPSNWNNSILRAAPCSFLTNALRIYTKGLPCSNEWPGALSRGRAHSRRIGDGIEFLDGLVGSAAHQSVSRRRMTGSLSAEQRGAGSNGSPYRARPTAPETRRPVPSARATASGSTGSGSTGSGSVPGRPTCGPP